MANEHTKYILKCDRKIGVSPSGEPIWQKNVFEEFFANNDIEANHVAKLGIRPIRNCELFKFVNGWE